MSGPLDKNEREGAVAESTGDTDIDRLLRARGEVDAALRLQKADFTVLFTDVVGSTAFFEAYGDTAGLMMLERHQELVLPAIEKAGGTVVKTIGDAVLAAFALPAAAVKAAIQIQQNLDTYNEDLLQNLRIYVRVGLNAGSGFVKEKDVFGDVVNVAARIVKTCTPAQILLSRSVYEAVGQDPTIRARPLGSAALHGKSAPEEIYEVFWTGQERYRRLREQLDAALAGKVTRSALGRYEILEELGRGAMGVVYKAYDPTVGRIVALKTVRLDAVGADREELARRLRQEAQAAGRLEHPNIVTIHDAGEAEGLFYLTMQFVKGTMLSEMIAERTLLPTKQIALLLDQVSDGLAYAHERGIIHRDLKPSNIIVSREGVAKILDFGVAKMSESGLTKAGMVLGTPSYMSPEQAQGARIDRRSDIFTLGSILYELLTGEKAFPGNSSTTILYKIVHDEPIPPRAIEPGIDPKLEAIVSKALAKDPFQRHQSCPELRAELQAYLAERREAGETSQLVATRLETTASPTAAGTGARARTGTRKTPAARRTRKKSPPRSRSPLRRKVWGLGAATAGVLLLAGLGGWAWKAGWISSWLGQPPEGEETALETADDSLPAAPPADSRSDRSTPEVPTRKTPARRLPSTRSQAVSPPPAPSPGPSRRSFELAAKHLHTFGDCRGTLEITDAYIEYLTPGKDARRWSYAQIKRVDSTSVRKLEIHTYEAQSLQFGRDKIFRFDLEKPLEARVGEFIQARVERFSNTP